MDDIDDIRRRLLLLGFGLLEVPGGFVVTSLYYESLSAGSVAQPLSLEEVRRFAA